MQTYKIMTRYFVHFPTICAIINNDVSIAKPPSIERVGNLSQADERERKQKHSELFTVDVKRNSQNINGCEYMNRSN